MIQRDINGREIPPGKVERRLEANFMKGTVPSWITTAGSASVTVGSLDTASPYLKIETTNELAGVTGPSVDLSNFKEVRWGMAASTDIQDTTDGWDFGLTDGTDGVNLSVPRADNNEVQIRYFEGGTTDDRVLNWNWMLQDGICFSEIRLRPEPASAILAGGGDSVVDFDESPPMSVGPVDSRIRVDSTGTSGTAVVRVHKLWLSVIE